MDARRDNVFTASYIWDEGFKEIGEPEAISIDECLESCGEFLDTIFVGDGVKVYREYIKEKLGDKAIFPPANALNSRASSVAALALDKAKRGETQSYLEMKPYYIRKSQAERELEEREKAEAERQRKEEELLAAWFFREEYLNAGWFKRLLLTIEFLIRDKRGEGHIPQIPDKVRMEIARCLLPDIIAFFESDKGQKEFEEWKKKNRTTISTKQKNNTHTH